MKFLRRIDAVHFENTVATIGNFDGMHCGHQALLSKLRAQADAMNLPLVVVLFEPQPSEFFLSDNAPARLMTLREKLVVLKNHGVDYVVCLRFNTTLSLMMAEDFSREVFFDRLKVRYLLLGEDFRFGQKRRGDVYLIKRLAQDNGCQVDVFPNLLMDNERISSTRVRRVLTEGNLAEAKKYLGRDFSLSGRVVRGQGRGRQWGVATANITMHAYSLPLKGVFCVHVKRKNQWLRGVANLGCRPTLDGTKNILEIHLLDFNESIYGERLQVFFLSKLRDEIKFSSIDALIAQIHLDVKLASEQLSGAIERLT